ncbi:MAG: cellulose synthase complex periplasmic endoglucanase BcsZ [Gallionella sp.]|nr:cellulose synthase complex periplasmic endoglucanase BcsZ [Gallionella sp.]
MRLLSITFILVITFFSSFAEASCAEKWPLWQDFTKGYIQLDGRVVDRGADGISTSEGQSYSLFSALVADDKVQFDRILKWTVDNLAQGNLSIHLPAWKWGKSNDGSWKTLDMNSASDADLWIAYSLFHAAEQWKEKSYRETAVALLRNIARREVVDLPAMGSMLLPAPYGFAVNANTWRLNPSYMPIQLLRYFAKVDKEGPWDEIAQNTLKMIVATSNRGLVADWVLYSVQKGFYPDNEKGSYTSYDAIRVYLWWAMLNQRDPAYVALRPYLVDVVQFSPENANLPERINVKSGNEDGIAPSGFAAAIAPYRRTVYGHKEESPLSLGGDSSYYDSVLKLLGYGWLDKRYQFDLNGKLVMGFKACLN